MGGQNQQWHAIIHRAGKVIRTGALRQQTSLGSHINSRRNPSVVLRGGGGEDNPF